MSTNPSENDESDEQDATSDDQDYTSTKLATDIHTGHILDRAFPGTPQAIRTYYEQLQEVFYELGTLGDRYPTIGFASNEGWYHFEELQSPEDNSEWTQKARVKRFDRHWDEIINSDLGSHDRNRELFNITSWKDPDAIETWQRCRYNPENNESEWEDDEKPTPGYESLYGFGFWCDLDLSDKAGRTDLTDEELDTIEAVQQRVIELVAEFYGVSTDAIYALDSGGGSYVYGPPEATIPIAEYFDDEDRSLIFQDICDRMNNGFATGELDEFDGLWPTVVNEIDGADDLYNPDFVQNVNRQSKAPGAIHHSHDIVVTPLRTRDPETHAVTSEIDYTPTLITDIDNHECEQLKTWASGLTAIKHDDAVDTLVRNLYPVLADRGELNTWQEILNERVETLRQNNKVRQQRQEDVVEALNEHLGTDIDVELDSAESLEPKGAIDDVDITTDLSEQFAAINTIDLCNVVENHASDNWDTSNRQGEVTFDPNWRDSESGKSCAIPDDQNTFIDNSCSSGGGPVKAYALGKEIIPNGEHAAAKSLSGHWGETLHEMRKDGYNIPVWVPEAGDDSHDYDATPFWAIKEAAVALGVLDNNEFIERENSNGETYEGFPDAETWNETLALLDENGINHGREQVPAEVESAYSQYPVTECAPPSLNLAEFEPEAYWEHLQQERYENTVEQTNPVIWHDPAGAGKTTNILLGAEDHDDNVAMLFKQHKKAREFITDDALPDDFDPFHLKGGEQKRSDACMDADHSDEDCPRHGHTSNCPSMCPVYNLDPDDEVRRKYRALANALGDAKAHVILGGELPKHGPEGGCPWFNQFDELDDADHVVGVHEYQLLKTVRDDRQVVIDETPASLMSDKEITIGKLTQIRKALTDYADLLSRDEPEKYTARNLASFIDNVIDAITDSNTECLSAVSPPTIIWDAYKNWNDVAGHYIERVEPDEEWHIAEALAQVKIGYTGMIIRRIERDDWEGTPLSLDPVLAAASAAGLPTTPVMQSIAAPSLLTACLWCSSSLEYEDGFHYCSSDDCAWDERHHTITRDGGPEARARARLEGHTMVYESLPRPVDLPREPVILDATATPEKIAQLYGTEPDELAVFGNKPFRANMRVTQVLSGQYHTSTVKNSITDDNGNRLPRDEWRSPADHIQTVLNKAGERYERPLFIMKRELQSIFTVPDNGEQLHYHATRGLNRGECDAVFCIGGPHANHTGLERQAELLALGDDDVRVGGTEHSTRQDEDIAPPVYRKLYYEDDRGRGRAVPTKHFTGLVGALFRESREKELVQAVHRTRPLLADKTVDVFLITNIPTTLPIDHVCSLDELTTSLVDALPLPRQALELLAAVAQADRGELLNADLEHFERSSPNCVAGTVSDYADLAQDAGIDVSKRQIRNYLNDLVDVGLVTQGEYKQNRGRPHETDLTASNLALQILSYNGFFEAEAVRRLAALAQSDATVDLVAALREEVKTALPTLNQSTPTEAIRVNGKEWTVSASCETKLTQKSEKGTYDTDLVGSG
ncbi:hypothetical protein SAMN05216226_1266 [Halovenus aranensis]|uniref:Uncharacterized protein n=1 Tax=Halovenus aranensis TaxID=890420 RepID=A0A1G8ZM65_9EURY|nr:hypothetical protein [Halovenus aranensis]SDK15240.1 hypothetical protein SAMN05216226_1266 [Halovenus aranensis]